MKKKAISAFLAASFLVPALAYAGDYSVGAQAGIFGLGANVKYKVNEEVGVRAGFDLLSINDFEVDDGEVNYNFDVSLQDVMVVADWHPWKGSFKTVAGLIVNGSNIDGEISPGGDGSITLNNGQTYTKDEIGSVSTDAEFDPVAPYIGIGWDTSFDKKQGFGFTCDLGIAFQGSMQTDYTVNYGSALDPDAASTEIERQVILATRADIEAQLDEEMSSLQDELDKYKIVPYISIGFNYKF